MNKLTIEQLSGYLPYYLRCTSFGRSYYDVVCHKNDLSHSSIHFERLLELDNGYKPILRPLSQLTEEMEQGGESFVPIAELMKLALGQQVHWFKDPKFESLKTTQICSILSPRIERLPLTKIEFEVDTDTFGFDLVSNGSNFMLVNHPLEIIQKLYEWHFDVFGLIDKQLAIEKK